MAPEWIAAIAAVVSLIGSVVVGLAATAAKAEVASLRAEMALNGARLETVRVEVRASIAEAVNDFYVRVNGNYVKREVCKIAMAGMEDRINQIREAQE
jgi:chaperone required for assembly of F1-ATPase